MSRLIRNRRNNFVSNPRTPGMMFLCEIPKNKIFTYNTGRRAYIATGKDNEDSFEAICIASEHWNSKVLGKKVWLKKSTFKKARYIGEKPWLSERRYSMNTHLRIQTNRFERWLSAADLRRTNPQNYRFGFIYSSYSAALAASEQNKSLFKEHNRLMTHTVRR